MPPYAYSSQDGKIGPEGGKSLHRACPHWVMAKNNQIMKCEQSQSEFLMHLQGVVGFPLVESRCKMLKTFDLEQRSSVHLQPPHPWLNIACHMLAQTKHRSDRPLTLILENLCGTSHPAGSVHVTIFTIQPSAWIFLPAQAKLRRQRSLKLS